MKNNWPNCKCDICLVMQSYKEQGIDLSYKEIDNTVYVAKILSVGTEKETQSESYPNPYVTTDYDDYNTYPYPTY